MHLNKSVPSNLPAHHHVTCFTCICHMYYILSTCKPPEENVIILALNRHIYFEGIKRKKTRAHVTHLFTSLEILHLFLKIEFPLVSA